MNVSLSTGVFPSKWKIGLIVPIFKGGDKSDVNNYRPVSLLPLPGKRLEKVVYRRLINFLNMHNILIQQENSFKAGHSTIDTVAKFTNDLFMNINGSKCTLAVFIDLKKAFDTVNHKKN